MSYPTSAIAVKRKKKGHKSGQVILNILIVVFVLICTLPFINVIAISLSSMLQDRDVFEMMASIS